MATKLKTPNEFAVRIHIFGNACASLELQFP